MFSNFKILIEVMVEWFGYIMLYGAITFTTTFLLTIVIYNLWERHKNSIKKGFKFLANHW